MKRLRLAMRPMPSPSRFVERPVSRKEAMIKICAWCSKDQAKLDELPPLSVSRRSVPAPANRHVYRMPSAERRARVQSLQNGRVTDVMTPNSPCPSR